MNLLYMKYAIEVAACGSVNKAAEKLYLDQPNLSRAIKDLESSLGVALFERSTRGMKLTQDGEIFLKYAKTILAQVDAVEQMFRSGKSGKKHFSFSGPRASYISSAFSAFSSRLTDEKEVEILYRETNAMRVIKNILEDDYKLGILRYAAGFDRYYKELLEEKGLSYELVAEFHYRLVMSASSPLARKEEIGFEDLGGSIEIAHGDPYVPSIPFMTVKKEELPDVPRRIFVFERASQFELLSENPETFMWVSPIPTELLSRYGLVERICPENKKRYKDVMIHRKDYRLTELDDAFIAELCRVKREVFRDKL